MDDDLNVGSAVLFVGVVLCPAVIVLGLAFVYLLVFA